MTVLDALGPGEQIVRQIPMVCREVFSPEDRLKRMLERGEDSFRMGVRHLWIFDPVRRVAIDCRPGGETSEYSAGELAIEGTPIRLHGAEIFSVLDED